MTSNDIRKIVKSKMRAMHISVPVLARRIDCHQQTIYNYLANTSELGADTLQRIFTVLDIKVKG